MRNSNFSFCRIGLAAMLSGANPAISAEAPPLRTVSVAMAMALTSAVAAAQPGDEVVLAPGQYAIGRVRMAASGTAEHPIVLRADPRGGAKIQVRNVVGFSITGAF